MISKLVLVVLAACATEAPIAGHNCPCADGFTCCDSNVCVPEGEACSVMEPVTTDLSALPCVEDEDAGTDGTIDTHWALFYDQAGNTTSFQGDDGLDGTIDQTIDQRFDAANQLLEVRMTAPDFPPQLETLTYDALERVVTDLLDFGDGATSLTTWTYDGLTATSEGGSDGVVDFRCVFQQNTAGRPVSGTCTNEPDGTLASTSTYTYDAGGRLVLRETMHPDLSSSIRHERTYDDAGRLLRFVLRSGDLVEFRGTNVYDPADGRLLVSTSQFPGPDDTNPPSTSTYRYCR